MIYVTFHRIDGSRFIRRYRGALDIDAIIAAARRYRDAHGYGSYSFKFYR